MEIVYDRKSWKTLALVRSLSGSIISFIDPKKMKNVERDRYSVQLGDDNYRVPMWSYINHSCDPSCEIKKVEDRYALVTMKNLERGDEITFNYLENEDEIAEFFECNCGSGNCVGKVNG